MKLLFDLFPVILFFATFKFGQSNADYYAQIIQSYLGGNLDPTQAPILMATAVAIVATILQVSLTLIRGKKVPFMLWMSLAIITVFGSLTIWLHNEMFIKWKPTILYWIFAAILLYGSLTKRIFLSKLFGKEIQLPQSVWATMQKAWLGFFIAVGILNLVVAYTFDTETWVNFKLFGLFGLTLIFTFAFGLWVALKTQKVQNSDQSSSKP